MVETVLSSIISFLFPAKKGQSEDNPLPLKAVPGLITLLDVALFRSVEGQLTATIASTHSLLACWMDIKKQAQIVLQLYKTKDFIEVADGKVSLHETLAYQCLEAASNAIERLSTDRLAAAANLSDAYESTKASAVNNHHHHHHHGGGIYSNDLFHSSQGANFTGVGLQGIRHGILLSKDETGRRGQLQQRRRDCWESPRLFCPDYVWADDVYLACRKWTRSLDKHPLVTAVYVLRNRDDVKTVDLLALPNTSKSGHSKSSKGSGSQKSSRGTSNARNNNNHGNNNSGSHSDNRRRRSNKQDQSSSTAKKRSSRYAVGDDPIYEEMGNQITILVELIQNSLPLRLYQFRSAMESEAVVTKRLYLVKCEYRAPFRSFLEAHQNLLRAPPMELVDRYLSEAKHNSSSRKGSGDKKKFSSSPETLKAELQALLNTPELVELLSLEMEAEKLELDIGKALFPFSELARSLSNKRVHLEAVSGIVDVEELPVLRETLRRLSLVLCRKGCSETSTGIRPILLDLLLIPRDDEPRSGFFQTKQYLHLYDASSSLEDRIDDFLAELSRIANLVQETVESRIPALNVDIGPTMSKGCTEDYDPELLKCQLLDWFDIVERQHCLHEDQKDLPEQIRRAEMKVSLSCASHSSLQTAKESLEMLKGIRAERYGILKEMVEEVCLREMSLYVSLTSPKPQEVLELKETPSAPGLLGIPLEIAGETLPIG